MNPIEKITGDEKELFARIVEEYSDPINPGFDKFDRDKFDFVLRFWNQNKQTLFKVLKENLILEKEIIFPMSSEELSENLYHFRMKSRFCQDFWKWYYKECFEESTEVRNSLRSLLLSYLGTNHYEGKTISIKDYLLRNGIKVVKALKNLNDKYIHSSHFEEFRLEHSRILNQKEIKGTLCLSIHPLDYLTLSDNNYDWDSCLSVINDCGSHRSGVIEMMNSECVVIAYIKGEKPFENWTNKKWRSLFIVNQDIISAIKAYPYDNKDITNECLKWLRELAEEAQLSTYYHDDIVHVSSGQYLEAEPFKKVKFFVRTNCMYNDYYGSHPSYVSLLVDNVNYINYSGPLSCLICGKTYTQKDGIFLGCGNCFPYIWDEVHEEWEPA